MKYGPKYFNALRRELVKAAKMQDRYDSETINLIAPASPTPLKYFYDLPLRHNIIAEGLLEHRPYAGVEGFNRIEQIAAESACFLFCSEQTNVDNVLSMRFEDGCPLTHGMRRNFSGCFFNFDFYGVDREGFLDYEEVEEKARIFKPKLIVCGASSYPRAIDFERLGIISARADSYLMADISHPAGLIVADRFPQPFPYCDVITLTLEKTMLGPHGGIVLCKGELAKKIDRGVHPGVQSSVPLRRLYQMAQCLIDASTPWFRNYIDRVIKNMKVFEEEFKEYPDLVVTGGSDTHLMVLNTHRTFGLTGRDAEKLLGDSDNLTNRQVVPGERLKPYQASGIRLGTSWITARGYTEDETRYIANIILENFRDSTNIALQKESKKGVKKMLKVKRRDDVWNE